MQCSTKLKKNSLHHNVHKVAMSYLDSLTPAFPLCIALSVLPLFVHINDIHYNWLSYAPCKFHISTGQKLLWLFRKSRNICRSVSRLILNICSTRIFEDQISLHDPWGWFAASLPWLDKMYSFSRMSWIREVFFKIRVPCILFYSAMSW
jgi:hypothetical protein